MRCSSEADATDSSEEVIRWRASLPIASSPRWWSISRSRTSCRSCVEETTRRQLWTIRFNVVFYGIRMFVEAENVWNRVLKGGSARHMFRNGRIR